ncbi:hypothetical protein EOK75_00450 [Pseudorhodobacter turbinis]|uniref:Uncharacterized protein n=1 Tax=Pseudorhodobacter turbinis TaxID=2500533 RepID=A0A4P8ECD1_9RHOB|nr:hypothetical protein [Pseudorhodobacter turbinis]QCO54426.1 hypothetical protein EOK75_00450 [Pseudorhodobacter turbinis]
MSIACTLRACLAVALVGMVFLDAPATAQTAELPTATAEAKVADLTGFRSAQFGDDVDAVLAAIKADFGLEGDAVKLGLNTVERTQVITISVPDVLADGGIAQISYIFGYQSKTLIQVGLLWAPATDPAMTDAMLYANGDVLRAFLASAGYVPETVTRDVVLENGILLFRGSDAKGHTAILLLQGRFEEKDGLRTLFPENLTLLYAVSPDNPDILTIKKGDF